jgi:polyferredoxin
MMEMVFRKLEYLIEGDAVEQKKLAAAPWTAPKLFKKVFKQAVFFALSFVVGNTLLAYIIGSDQLIQIVTDDPRAHVTGLTFMILFTLVFYAIFARFREQACTFICPYGRFQSTMLDENTMVVAYDHKRGEKRGRLIGWPPGWATALIATNAWRCVPRVLTSATACRWSACIARRALTRATP